MICAQNAEAPTRLGGVDVVIYSVTTADTQKRTVSKRKNNLDICLTKSHNGDNIRRRTMFGDINSSGNPLKDLLNQLKQEDSVLRAQLNDQRLMKLAEYDLTEGYMRLKSATPDALQNKFYELKRKVRDGSFTLKALEDDVFTRWGIQEESRDIEMKNNPDQRTVVTGFDLNSIDVADLPEGSPENH
jgi:hypothetical protein